MNAVDASEHYEEPPSHEQSPSLLTIILDTNPAAWALLSPNLTLSATVANLLVFINAHLAGNYTNKVAVVASHCDKAQWLYPTPTTQSFSEPSRRQRHNGSASNDTKSNQTSPSGDSGAKYRPFRLIEEELLNNLTTLLRSTTPDSLSYSTSTMIAGALTLALTYINRESTAYTESLTGPTSGSDKPTASSSEGQVSTLQSRILLVNASPSADLAHQYIPIMNAIFACQRLAIPIDILQLPLPSSGPNSAKSPPNSTVFLQQASDATAGIFLPLVLPSTKSSDPQVASQILQTYLLTSLLPSATTRASHLVLPTDIAVDFRAACFCHRNVVSTGYVCSICLSIFCSVPEGGECLTCGTVLDVKGLGKQPVVVGRRKKKRAGGTGTPGVGTPR